MKKSERAFLIVTDVLEKLSKIFVKEAKLSFIMRVPGNVEAEMLVTDDDLNELINLIERSKNRNEVKPEPDHVVQSSKPTRNNSKR